MLSNVSLTCFVASYAWQLVTGGLATVFRCTVRWVVMIGFAAAGLLAHSAYLWHRVQDEFQGGTDTLASWYDWCLVVAWVLAAIYLALAIRRPQNPVGLFLLPLVLALIAAAYAVADVPTFGREAGTWLLGHVPRYHVASGNRGRRSGLCGRSDVLAAILPSQKQTAAADPVSGSPAWSCCSGSTAAACGSPRSCWPADYWPVSR